MDQFPSLTPADSPQTIFDKLESYVVASPMNARMRSMSRSLLDVGLGIGRLSGIALYQFGLKVVEGVYKSLTHRKLRHIRDMLKRYHEEWSKDKMIELLVMRRAQPGFFNHFRKEAWDLILYALDRGGSKQVARALKPWGSHRVNFEMDIFMWELAACKLSGWTIHPRRSNVRLNEEHRTRCIFGTPRPQSLTTSFLMLLTDYIESKPLPSKRSFSLEWIVALLVTRPVAQEPRTLDSDLSLFFLEFARHDLCWEIHENPVHVSMLPDMFTGSFAARCLISYLALAPRDVRQRYITTIVDHIISVIRPLANGTEASMVHVDLYPQVLAPVDRQSSHPAWPFLSFAMILTWKSSDAARVFLDRGFIRDVHKLARRFKDTKHSTSLHSMYSSIITTCAMHSLSVSSMKRFVVSHSEGDVEQLLQEGGFNDQAAASPQRMFSVETQSTTTLRSVYVTPSNPPSRSSSVGAPGPFVSSPASISDPLPLVPEDEQNTGPAASVARLAQDCLERAESFTIRDDTETAVNLFSYSANLVALALQLKIRDGWVRRDAEPEEVVYKTCENKIRSLCDAHKIPRPRLKSLPPRMPPMTWASTSGAPVMPIPMSSLQTRSKSMPQPSIESVLQLHERVPRQGSMLGITFSPQLQIVPTEFVRMEATI